MAGKQAAPPPGHAVTPRHVVAGPIDHQLPDKRHIRESVAHLEPKEPPVRPGRVQIRPLGGWPGCLLMILFSLVASVVGTVLLNLLL
jgi:hypothetical protein